MTQTKRTEEQDKFIQLCTSKAFHDTLSFLIDDKAYDDVNLYPYIDFLPDFLACEPTKEEFSEFAGGKGHYLARHYFGLYSDYSLYNSNYYDCLLYTSPSPRDRG